MLHARLFGAALILVLALPTAACADTAAEPSPAAPNPAAAPVGTANTAVPESLRFTGRTLDGADFAGSSLAGQAAVLWFWAPWCPRCQGEARNLARLAGEFTGKVAFVGVAAQDQVPAMREFVAKFKVDGFRHLADPDAAIWRKFGIVQQPAYAFVRPDGTVDVVGQQLTEESLTRRVNELSDY